LFNITNEVYKTFPKKCGLDTLTSKNSYTVSKYIADIRKKTGALISGETQTFVFEIDGIRTRKSWYIYEHLAPKEDRVGSYTYR
jgi:hypothetical protein